MASSPLEPALLGSDDVAVAISFNAAAWRRRSSDHVPAFSSDGRGRAFVALRSHNKAKDEELAVIQRWTKAVCKVFFSMR
jgi:hypothetical protein